MNINEKKNERKLKETQIKTQTVGDYFMVLNESVE